MRSKYIILYLLVGVCQTNAQVPSSCNLPPALYIAYQDEVPYIALRRIYQINSHYKDSILIPQHYQDSIWDGLAAIYNAASIPERDSVFDIYCIHQYIGIRYHFPNTIRINIDTTYSWTSYWRNLQISTGYFQLDSFLSFYGFDSVIVYYSHDNSVKLSTTKKINLEALSIHLASYDGIYWAEPESTIGDGNRILFSTDGLHKVFSFFVRWGDCLAGCVFRYGWHFSVTQDCSVQFDSIESGIGVSTALPLPVNCNLSTSITDSCGYINNPNIQADFNYSINAFTVDFTNHTVNYCMAVWYFGDGDSSHSQHPIHTYSDTGTYTITLIVWAGTSSDTIEMQIKITGTVGVGNKPATANSPQIKIYPNPATSTIHIYSMTSNISYLTVMNLSGKDILRTTQTEINVAQFSRGLYFIRLELGNGENVVRKIVVQ